MYPRHAARLAGGAPWCLLMVAAIACAQEPPQPGTSLLQPNSLNGWRAVFDNESTRLEDVWSVADGVLSCTGQPAGYLITTRNDFRDYVLSLEWRWHAGRGGNNGLLVHCSTPGVLGVWCRSVEVQLADQDAGDFWIIGTQLQVPDEAHRRQDRRYQNLVDGVEKPLGEWNQLEVTCRGDEMTVRVNGVLVNHATDVSDQQGAIALQSEGTPIQFRQITLRPLP